MIADSDKDNAFRFSLVERAPIIGDINASESGVFASQRMVAKRFMDRAHLKIGDTSIRLYVLLSVIGN
jgi:hypothetical protein